jgi:hypothetical protein
LSIDALPDPYPVAGAAAVVDPPERLPHALARPANDEHPGAGGVEMPRQHETEPGRAARHDHPSVLPDPRRHHGSLPEPLPFSVF